MGHGVKKPAQQNPRSKNHMALLSFCALQFGHTAVYDHILGVRANYRIGGINIKFCLAVNPCFVTGKNGFKRKIFQKIEILKFYLHLPLTLVEHLKG